MKLYLDDVRTTPKGWVRAYTAKEAIDILKTCMVSEISFDHDLGDREVVGDGYEVAKWIEEKAFDGTLMRIEWHVHSDNGPGRQNIEAAMRSAERFWERSDIEEGGF